MINSKILALKYRPQEFKDLIGQEVMAQTITNSIRLGKTPNAYLLTGIRGVGKTTTARLIAKALNCLKNLDKNKKCSQDNFCESCNEISNSNHIDILEMDAASKTGIDDVRELIENSKYSPTSAQYKIFIIDEVHMLSKQAFNGLLKTLEEPPPRLKFILATTEVRKIPVTILSRCQRFDLKRVNLDTLFKHLQNISNTEKGEITDDALKLIARASEGSVRDAISLLDRALIAQNINNNKKIEDYDVRQMLGLADRSKLIFLFREVLLGNQSKSINYLKELIDSGLDAKNFLNDILEILYLFSRSINLGPIDKDMMIPEAEAQLIDEYKKNINMQDLGLFWQLTIKTMDDLKVVTNENLTLEMFIMQLIYLKNIDKGLEEQIDIKEISEKENNNELQKIDKLASSITKDKEKKINLAKDQIKNTEQFKKDELKITNNKKIIKNFEDLIYIASEKKEVELKYDLERNVNLVSFSKGKIDISFNEKLNKNFIKNLTEKLLSWTGERWIISLNKESGEKTIYEKNLEKKIISIKEEIDGDLAKKLTSAFPDAQLIDIKDEDA